MQELFANCFNLFWSNGTNLGLVILHFHHAQLFRLEMIEEFRAMRGQHNLTATGIWTSLEFPGKYLPGTAAGEFYFFRFLEKQYLLGRSLVKRNQVGEESPKSFRFINQFQWQKSVRHLVTDKNLFTAGHI